MVCYPFFLVLCWHVHTYLDPFPICVGQSSRRTKIPWQHDLFEDSLRAAGLPGLEAGTKLYISNLDYGVTNEDIRVQLELYTSTLSTLCNWLSFIWRITCDSGTFLWDWRHKKICSSLWEKWTPKCKCVFIFLNKLFTNRSYCFVLLAVYSVLLLGLIYFVILVPFSIISYIWYAYLICS